MTLPTFAGVQSAIYHLPGRPPVMTVHDLANFFDVKPIRLMEQVRRNPERFPDGFLVIATEAEKARLITQNALSNQQARGEVILFTERGALQLASVLRSPVAAQVSVLIIEAFLHLRDVVVGDLRMALSQDKAAYIGRSTIRKLIEEAAQKGWSWSQLVAAAGCSQPQLVRHVQGMRVRGFIPQDRLLPPPYVLRAMAEKAAHLDAHEFDQRQLLLNWEG
jgi:hypothetical protein